jgi:hypothetical protein
MNVLDTWREAGGIRDRFSAHLGAQEPLSGQTRVMSH